jgi:hypothetical protein
VVLSRHDALADAEVVACVRMALREHGVLIFPGQTSMEPEDEVALARCFAHDESEEHPAVTAWPNGQPWYEPWLKVAPAVRLVGRATLRDYYGISCDINNGPGVSEGWDAEQRMWHQDGLPDAAPAPPRVVIMRAIRVPSVGGDTLFACTRRIADLLLRDEARRSAPDSAVGALDPPASLARCTYTRHKTKQVALDGVAMARGEWAASNAPMPCRLTHSPSLGGGMRPLLEIPADVPRVTRNASRTSVCAPGVRRSHLC